MQPITPDHIKQLQSRMSLQVPNLHATSTTSDTNKMALAEIHTFMITMEASQSTTRSPQTLTVLAVSSQN